ncbi:MAG: aminotransferase class V-fold PLP-dependent enzyme [Ruminococcus sp.]|nr:aminotransferase class V-fold PLP-dependent enzyme [Ruminococcus sp.]
MIYLDNSATTYPKPPEVLRAVQNAVREYSFNPGRGGYRHSLKTSKKVYQARETIRKFFNAPSVESVILTPGCTQSINMAVKGVLKNGDHVIISSLEHNAVVRPLHKLKEQGKITYSIAEAAPEDDEKTIQNFRDSINQNTRMIICTHASNVFGFRLPVERLCALAHSYGILFCLDAAQSAGILPIDMEEGRYDFVCCAGHKYLYGPMGIGLLITGKDITVDSLIEGGTGSVSSELTMPSFYPDKLEAGTLNIPGILGLEAGIQFVERNGINNIYEKESHLINYLRDRIKDFRYLKIYENSNVDHFDVPLLAFSAKDTDSESVANYLSEKYDIAVRGGLHCAPTAHESMGTSMGGIVRIAPSVFTTQTDMNLLVNSLRKFR